MAKIFDWDGRNGTLIDSVSKTAGTLTAGTGGFKKTEKGMAMEFDGSATKIDTNLAHADLDLTGDITIEVWVKAYSFGENNAGRITENGKLRFVVTTANNNFRLESDGSTQVTSADNSVILNKWQHILVSRNSAGDATNFYINSLLSGSADQDSGTPENGADNLFIGDRVSGSTAFDGNIARVVIHDKILTQAERNELHKEFLNSYGTTEQKRNFTYPKPTDLSSEVDRGSDLIAPLDFNNWTLSSGTVVTNDSFTGATSLYKSITTIGKKYNYNVVGTTTDSNLKFYDGFTGATLIKDLGTGSFSATGTFTSQASSGIPTAIQFDLADANSTTTITNFTITELTGLVAAYNFIPSKGKLIDISGQGNDGTISGALSTKDGMKFDGVDDYVDLDAHTASVASLSEGSIVTRFKYANTTDNQTLFSSSDKSDSSSDINIKTDPAAHRLIFVIRENAGFVLDADLPSDYADGLWHTYIVAVNSSGNKHYVDGMQVTPDYSTGDASTQGFFSDVNDLDTLRIGNREDSGGNEYYWDGDVGELKIYSYALTAQQAKAYHNSFIKPVLIETFKDSGADGIVKTPKGWM